LQHTPSRFLKVAQPAAAPAQRSAAPALQHAHPGFDRFMAAHPRISRFIEEHPKESRFLLRVAHHIPVVERYVPVAWPHLSPVFSQRARPRPRPRYRF
jgi:hypothetical protein